MLKIILPILLAAVGTGAGVGAGLALRPTPDPEAAAVDTTAEPAPAASEDPAQATTEFVKMNNQFVIPVLTRDNVSGLVVLTLSLEVPAGERPAVYEREPKLRDSFLQVLFDHANVGGFDGHFTDAANMDILRRNLREVAQRDAGDRITDVLILDIARQDY